MRLPSLKAFIGLLLITICTVAFGQYTMPEKPAILYPVNDFAGLLNEQEKQSLNEKLIKFEDSTSTEIVVVIIPTTKGEDVNFLATKYGQEWGVGKDKTDNGIVFLIAKDDRTMAIQGGRSVEKYLTASVAGQILDYIVTPNFRQGLWYEGINRGTSALMEAVQGKFKPEPQEPTGNGEISLFKIILVLFIIFIILRFLFRNRGGGDGDEMITRRGRRTYPGGFFPFPMGGGGFGGGFGGGGFGGGGGGFGGFGGGGDFGGGGASGSW